MDTSQRDQSKSTRPQKKLRSACDSCHQNKVRCSGETPCRTCDNLDMQCVYSVSNRIGRPRGTKNKKTLDRLNKTGDGEQQNQHTTRNAEGKGISEQNDVARDVFIPSSIHPQLSAIQTQVGPTQPCSTSTSAPLSAGIASDFDILDLSLPAPDDPLLSVLEPTASWPTYHDFAGLSTSGVRLIQR